MAALRKSRAKAFWEEVERVQRFWAAVVRAPTLWAEVEQVEAKGETAEGEAPTGVVASLPVSPTPEPTQRPYPGVPGTRVPVAEEITSAEAEVDLRPAFNDFTVIVAPPVAFVEMRVQTWSTVAASELVTDPVDSVPSASVPPLPEKLPEQAMAAACVPTLKERLGSTLPDTVIWSSAVTLIEMKPGSSFT